MNSTYNRSTKVTVDVFQKSKYNGHKISMLSAYDYTSACIIRDTEIDCILVGDSAAMLMAGLDGIQNKINPGDPLEKDIYGLPPEEAALVPSVPATLNDALKSLDEDYSFLRKGDVFSEDIIDTWKTYKWEREIIPAQSRPTPYDFYLYYDL